MGWTEPNERGRRYRRGTATAYGMARCRCRHCKDAVAAYRAARRAAGKDQPRTPRTVDTDGQIGRGWFRTMVWLPALAKADVGFHVSPHGLRHAHASWLLAGGANLQVVKERLGHASITTTEKYLHTLPNADAAALEAMDRIRAPRESPARAAGARERTSTQRAAELSVNGKDLDSVIQIMDVETVRLLLTDLVHRAQAANEPASS